MFTPSESLSAWHLLASTFCDRPDLGQHLLRLKGSIEATVHFSTEDLRRLPCSAGTARTLLKRREEIFRRPPWSHWQALGITLLSQEDPRFPRLLRCLAVPPLALYVRGSIEVLDAPTPLACVGSRKMTSYGQQAIERILPGAVNAGATIISGLALGVDAACHQVAVDLHRPTVAVLGGGVDESSIQPATNHRLAIDIISNRGAIISEYPPQTPSDRHRFPQRNRLIAGLAVATLVIEAAKRSGSLITARLALEENRDVFAVPGNITQPQSIGTNALLQQGARLIPSCQELCDALLLNPRRSEERIDRSEEERKILSALTDEPMRVDKLFESCTLPIATFHHCLTRLELEGALTKNGEWITHNDP